MSKMPAEHIAIPTDLAILLQSAGLDATLAVVRQDGAPLTDADRELLSVLIEGYELGRDLRPTEAEINAGVAKVLAAQSPPLPLASTGNGG